MSIINVENLTFSYLSDCDNVFENVNFQIDTDWKLGFVGRNGRGKTTFLNLLLGKYEYRGKITASVQFDYFPYEVKDKNVLTYDVLREVCPIAEEWRIMRELSLLKVDYDCLYRPFCTLSNGEQTKTLIAALFLNEGHFPLLDEPTNHLDLQARKLLSAYLCKKKGFILVSHDRSFLDGCVDHILSINKTAIEVQSGNYSSFAANFENRQEFERKKDERLQSDIHRLTESAARSAVWADKAESSKRGAFDKGFIGHKSEKMMKRAKSAEARIQKAIEEKSSLLKNSENESSLKMFPLPYRKETVLTLTDVVPVYGGKEVCRPVSLQLKRGQRAVLFGRNGSGKSSLLKLLLNQPIEYRGKIEVPPDLIISYVSQDASNIRGRLDDIAASAGIDESLFKTILYKMGFNRRQFEIDTANFSEGQKKKALLAKSLCEKAHLYVWDEPLNYIDVYSRVQIENLILQYAPTMIFVEHDEVFQKKIATDVIEL